MSPLPFASRFIDKGKVCNRLHYVAHSLFAARLRCAGKRCCARARFLCKCARAARISKVIDARCTSLLTCAWQRVTTRITHSCAFYIGALIVTVPASVSLSTYSTKLCRLLILRLYAFAPLRLITALRICAYAIFSAFLSVLHVLLRCFSG